jgi:hypothetical protein
MNGGTRAPDIREKVRGTEYESDKPMPRDITMKQLRIVATVCAISLSIAQVNAEDQFLVDEANAAFIRS